MVRRGIRRTNSENPELVATREYQEMPQSQDVPLLVEPLYWHPGLADGGILAVSPARWDVHVRWPVSVSLPDSHRLGAD